MSLHGDIPDKVFYTISEVSQYTGVEPHVLRYWETKFSKLRPKRMGGNQRRYSRADLEMVFQIMALLGDDGYTIDGAERKLRGGASAKDDIDTTPEGLQREISLLRRDIQSMLDTF